MPALVISDGTALSWGEVFDEYAPALTSYARSRGVREPEDLVQDVFVAAVKQLPGFVGDRSGLRSLLFTIAYRRIADHHRRCYRRPETLVAEQSPRPDPGPTVEQIVDLGETAGQAMQAFAVLSVRERRVIEMRILEEDSTASVGRALGLSIGNVRVIQARALVKIRKHLRSMGEGGFPQPMVSGGALFDSFRYLRTKLPADDLLGPWIEEMRSNSSAPTLEDTTAASSAAMASGSVAATARATDTAYSLVSAVISSGAARIGAAVSVVALSTVPLLPAVDLGAESSSPFDKTNPVVEARAAESTPDHAAADTPTSVGSVAIEAPQPSGSVLDNDATQGADPAAGEPAEVPEVTPPDVVEDVVEPLVVDTVDALVGEVEEPLVDVVAVVVEDTVEVVDEVEEPVVDVVVVVVEDTVEAVQPLVDDLTDTLDEVVRGLGGLRGGR